jgi:hypothetical protein
VVFRKKSRETSNNTDQATPAKKMTEEQVSHAVEGVRDAVRDIEREEAFYDKYPHVQRGSLRAVPRGEILETGTVSGTHHVSAVRVYNWR